MKKVSAWSAFHLMLAMYFDAMSTPTYNNTIQYKLRHFEERVARLDLPETLAGSSELRPSWMTRTR